MRGEPLEPASRATQRFVLGEHSPVRILGVRRIRPRVEHPVGQLEAVKEGREAMGVEPIERRQRLQGSVTREERPRHVEEKGSQVFEGRIRITGEVLQHGFEVVVRETGLGGGIGHGWDLAREERRTRRMSEEAPDKIDIEGTSDRLAKEQGLRRGSLRDSDPKRLGRQVMPRDVSDDICGHLGIGEDVAPSIRPPERQIQTERAVPPTLRSGEDAKSIAVTAEYLLEVAVEPDVAEGRLVVDRELVERPYVEGQKGPRGEGGRRHDGRKLLAPAERATPHDSDVTSRWGPAPGIAATPRVSVAFAMARSLRNALVAPSTRLSMRSPLLMLTSLALLLVASAAHAGNERGNVDVDDDGPSAAPYRAAPPSPSGPTHVEWYGWETLLADGVATSFVVLAATTDSSRAGPPFAYTGVTTFALGGPIIHATHHRWGIAFADLGIRVGGVFLGALTGALIGSATSSNSCGNASSGSDNLCIPSLNGAAEGAALGLLFGVVGASVIDSAVLAREKVRDKDDAVQAGFAWSPTIAPVRGGATAGLVARF